MPSTKPAATTDCLLAALPGERIRHVYFPTGNFISRITRIDGCARTMGKE